MSYTSLPRFDILPKDGLVFWIVPKDRKVKSRYEDNYTTEVVEDNSIRRRYVVSGTVSD